MVTFSHFTVPRWFAAEGGFESGDAPARFAAFAARATESLGDLISYATTFNEANIPRVIRQVYRGPGSEAAIEAMPAPRRQAVGSDRFSSLIFAPVEARSEERRVGLRCVSPHRSLSSRDPLLQNHKIAS